MKLKIFLFIILILALCRINSLIDENKRLKSNQDILLSEKAAITTESQKYKVADSLNAIKVSELQLTLAEYKKYRANDLQLIKQLKSKKSDAQKVISAELEMHNGASAKLKDTITNQSDTLKCFNYKSKWTDISGCIDFKRDTIDLQIKNRESLIIVNTVVHKRFLGFLWKTKKVKSQQTHVLSHNPNTEIVNCECINVKK